MSNVVYLSAMSKFVFIMERETTTPIVIIVIFKKNANAKLSILSLRRRLTTVQECSHEM